MKIYETSIMMVSTIATVLSTCGVVQNQYSAEHTFGEVQFKEELFNQESRHAIGSTPALDPAIAWNVRIEVSYVHMGTDPTYDFGNRAGRSRRGRNLRMWLVEQSLFTRRWSR